MTSHYVRNSVHDISAGVVISAENSVSGERVLMRNRLIADLEAAAQSPLSILRGPLRSGKSLAVNHWAGATQRNIAWFQPTWEAESAQEFWRQLEAVLLPGQDGSPLAQTFDPLDAARGTAKRLGEQSPLTVIIEDFHVAKDPAVQKALIELLSCSPALSLLVVARTPLAIESLGLTPTVAYQVIEPFQLLFTEQEAAAFHDGTPLAAISRLLHEKFDGAPVLHQAAHRSVINGGQTELDHVVAHVEDVLAQELRTHAEENFSEAALRFVILTLPLEDFDADLVHDLDSTLPLPELLESLMEGGVIQAQPGHGTPRYSYHGLSRDLLEQQLSERLDATRRATLQKAALHEFKVQNFLNAMRYSIAAGDYRLTSKVISFAGPRQIQLNGAGFTQALQMIPLAAIRKHAPLAFGLAMAYGSDKHTRLLAAEYFRYALEAPKPGLAFLAPAERLFDGLLRCISLRRLGELDRAATAARDTLQELSELPALAREEFRELEAMVLAQCAHTLIFVGDLSTATKALHQGVAAARATNSQHALFSATSLLAYRYAVDGDFHTAAEYAVLAADIWPEAAGGSQRHRTAMNLTWAMIEVGKLRAERADHHLAKTANDAQTSEFYGRILATRGKITLLKKEAALGLGRIELLYANRHELPEVTGHDAAALAVVVSALHLATGNAGAASEVLDQLTDHQHTISIARARIELTRGQAQAVLELLAAPQQPDFSSTALQALVLTTVARLHAQPATALKTELGRISGMVTALQNQWALALVPLSDLKLLLNAWESTGIPAPILPAQAESLLPSTTTLITLTPREASILESLAHTGDRAQIASEHFVSVNTIKSQLRSLYKKLNVSTREDALLAAHRHHLIGN